MDKPAIGVGDLVKDVITGFTGIVVADTEFLHGCRRLMLQSQELKDGKVIDPESFDIPQLELLKSGAVPVQPVPDITEDIGLGDVIKDRITGYQGVITSDTTWLFTVRRFTVQSKEMKDGVPVKAYGVDAFNAILVDKSPERKARSTREAKPANPARPGGPHPNPTRTND